MTEVDFTDVLWLFLSPWCEDKLEDDDYIDAIARAWVALWNYTISPTSIKTDELRRVCTGLFDMPTDELVDVLSKRRAVFFPDDNRLIEEYRVIYGIDEFGILVTFFEPNRRKPGHATADTFGEGSITMNLTFDEGSLFYDLYAALLSFVNRKLKVSSEQFSDSREYTSTPPEARIAIRDALFAHRELIDEFVRDNPVKLSADDLEIVVTWNHAVVGEFYVFRYLKKYTVFLTSGGSPNKVYGVLGLADPLEEVVGPRLPRLITTVLLPFQGRIIYDGLISGYNIIFGGGVKRTLNEEYKEAKEAFGIITSLENNVAP